MVFDRSAVEAFMKQSVAVGEMIAVLMDDDADFGVPVTVLAEASLGSSAGTAAMLTYLVRHVAFAPLGIDPEGWPELAAHARRFASVEPAIVMHAAQALGAYVLTATPSVYVDESGQPADRVITIEE
jgi:hypothetical protein